MLIKITKPSDAKTSEITPQSLFKDRRRFIKAAAATGAGLAVGPFLMAQEAEAGAKLLGIQKSKWQLPEKEWTPKEDVTEYNNFYEFGTSKESPERNAKKFKPKPWTVKVEGEVDKPGDYDFEDLVRPHQLEERVYRHRCVEAWSMVVPWVGIPLADVIKRMGPTSKAKYVAFETLFDPERMPFQTSSSLDWPYVEGLRMDEAMNPLTLLVTGLYGEELPNQNGAPIRLVTPWKYGFKGIKSIVKISFTEKQPSTTWNKMQPGEYGFYANVNPEVDHPRWSQAKERRIGDFLKSKTLMFNGYADEVASLYSGMDLAENF
ncbi:MAG: protein-methionine-sulfoxide reductase catalytic subunit MsrP [Rhodospirillales bacterium]|nr:protein-methionine-sulfoxide reductase catalytic subunit MsrP [Rhodospirillales bacterium]